MNDKAFGKSNHKLIEQNQPQTINGESEDKNPSSNSLNTKHNSFAQTQKRLDLEKDNPFKSDYNPYTTLEDQEEYLSNEVSPLSIKDTEKSDRKILLLLARIMYDSEYNLLQKFLIIFSIELAITLLFTSY